MSERISFKIYGQVQGVGFRPFIWRLAKERGLSGHVANAPFGAAIEIQGEQPALEDFEARLKTELPPLAKITRMEKALIAPKPQETGFSILASTNQGNYAALATPDIGVCGDCLNDIRAPGNPRYGYAFTNCTNCGPRFSITRTLPYDRSGTTMACFPMCPACRTEYENPADRRFHAQPVACPKCGPRLWRMETGDIFNPDANDPKAALLQTCRDLAAGKIVAIRGLGGFQLACDARNEHAVASLRQRKSRPHKALAVMAPDIAVVQSFCRLERSHMRLLQSREKPITLCPKSASLPAPLASQIAPDTDSIGVMLPNTPLHALIFDELIKMGLKNPVLVMTSANPQGQPICLGNREAVASLGKFCDSFLLHDRDILCRVDDSVVAPGPVFYRRARGYTPASLVLGKKLPPGLGVGAQLKSTFCLTRDDMAFLSQHIGDLDSPATLAFFKAAYAHMRSLLQVEPQFIVHDLHPDYISTNLAKSLAREMNIPAIGLQHHAAHAAACLAEHPEAPRGLALCLDGSGLGADGAIWGGELMLVDMRKPKWDRIGGLDNIHLPGGEKAIREPWRIALVLANELGLAKALQGEAAAVLEMAKRGINTPETSSCGRLFDAVAAQLGICREITYEGQAAIRLETAASKWLRQNGEKRILETCDSYAYNKDGFSHVAGRKIFAQAEAFRQEGKDIGAIAAWFHKTLAGAFAEIAIQAATRHNLEHVALTGGSMQNQLLTRFLNRTLANANLALLMPHYAPPGDGGIALGQAVWGGLLALNNQLPS